MRRLSDNTGHVLEQAFRELRMDAAADHEVEQAAARTLHMLETEYNAAGSQPSAATRPAASPATATPFRRRLRLGVAAGWAAAAVVLFTALLQIGIVRELVHWNGSATAESVEGESYGFRDLKMRPLKEGQKVDPGEAVQTRSDSGMVLALSDGSRIEMGPETKLSLDRGLDGIQVLLDYGSVIVTAASQGKGHLDVQTKDFTVSVVGTVFSVNANPKGSRVSVIEGEVRVSAGKMSTVLLPGQQFSSSQAMSPVPVQQDIAWSRNLGDHLTLLENSGAPAASDRLASTSSGIEGIVLEAGTNAPLSLVELQIAGMAAITGVDGRFTFRDLPAGRHLLRLDKRGYFLEARKTGYYLRLAPGHALRGLVYTMFPSAVVAGRVRDPQGRPARATIMAYRWGYDDDGGPTLVAVSADGRAAGHNGIATNELGEFRIYNLRPGAYVFGLQPPPGEARPDQPGARFVPFFYPATTDAGKAQLVRVDDGPETRLDDITTHAPVLTRGATLRVRLTQDSPNAFGGTVILRPRGAMALERSMTFRPGAPVVEFFDAPPGSYEVLARSMAGDKGNPGKSGFVQGSTTVQMGTTDTETGIVMSAAPILVGRVDIESGGITAPAPGVKVFFDALDSHFQATSSAPDGTFKIEGYVHPGAYRVRVADLPPGAVVVGARTGKLSVLNEGFLVKSTDAAIPIVITIGAPAAVVRGTVTGAGGKLPGAVVVLTPDDRSQRYLYASASANEQGGFELPATAPGNYHLFAWKTMDGAAYKNAGFMKKYEAQGIPVRVENGVLLPAFDVRALDQ